MYIAIHTPDKTNFPNYALMKISAYHKSIGDTVEWFDALINSARPYDKIYSSKVFTFTDDDHFLPMNSIVGGTGYGLYDSLQQEIENVYPDYSVYPQVDYAIGFLTRGCPNHCAWCCVPKKEGTIKAYRTWEQVKRIDSRDIVFMDNNVLASEHGVEQIDALAFAKHNSKQVRVDFNQGLDARLITREIAEKLSKLQWYAPLRMACDTKSQMPYLEQAVKYLREFKTTPRNYFCYVLVKDIDDAYERVEFLRNLGVDPFAQAYRDFGNNIQPTKEQKDFERWVNHKAIFKTVKWEDYGKK